MSSLKFALLRPIQTSASSQFLNLFSFKECVIDGKEGQNDSSSLDHPIILRTSPPTKDVTARVVRSAPSTSVQLPMFERIFREAEYIFSERMR